MSWGLTWLGLDDSTPVDVRAIKRAYAQRLRVTRPDDDPVAFQQLHAAYQDALAWLQARDEAPVAGAITATRTAPPAVAAARSSAPALDIDAVGARIAAFARGHDAATLEAWLQQQPELWSLGDKPGIGVAVLHALQVGDPPLSPEVVACLTECFAWDDLHGDIDHGYLEAAVRRWDQAWLLSPQGGARLGQRYMDVTDALLLPDSSVLRSLRQPRPMWRNLLTTLVPTRANEAIGVLRALDFWTTRQTPPGLAPVQVAFWARFGNEGDRIHLLTGALRAGMLGAFFGLVCLWGMLGSWPLPPSGDGQFSGPKRAGLIILIGTLFVPALWLAGVGWRGLLRWQSAPEHARVALPALRILTVPLLVATAMGSFWLALHTSTGVPTGALAGVVVGSSMIVHVAWRRRLGRGGPPPAKAGTFDGLWMALTMLMVVPAWITALMWWAEDLQRHQGYLRWSNRETPPR